MENPTTGPTPAPAATLIMIRENRGRLQTYLLKRSSQSGFMAGLHVFPGGTLDRQDRDWDLWQHHGDLDPRQLRRLIGGQLPLAEASAFAVAAIRECIEEAGVFFAQSDGRSPEDFKRVAGLAQSAARPQGWLAEIVAQEGWVLTFSALHRWSHWITPPQMKRRYDTRFFIAVMPTGQTCRPDARETVAGVWIDPRQALVENLSGHLPLSPPTLVTLQQLLPYGGLEDLLPVARSRGWGPALEPRLVSLEHGALIVEPWDPAYHRRRLAIAPQRLESAVLGVGEPFSRMWCRNGLWRPVAVC